MTNPFESAEPWEGGAILPAGTHQVEIVEMDDDGGTMLSSNGNPMFVIKVENQQGSIKEWMTVTSAALGKVVSLTDSAGLSRPSETEYDPQTLRLTSGYLRQLLGKRLTVSVVEEPDRRDPTGQTMRTRIAGFKPAGAASNDPPPGGFGARSDVPSDMGPPAAAVKPKDSIPFLWDGPPEFEGRYHSNRP